MRWTTQALSERGVDSARLDAELLLGAVIGQDRLAMFMDYDRPASEPERERYRAMVRRRLSGECVAYILGNRDFYGRSFAVGPGALVPRPETEQLCDLTLEVMPQIQARAHEPWRLLDVGTGSGCLGLTLALERPSWQVEMWEISEGARAWAERNCAAYAQLLGGRAQLLACDAMQALPVQRPHLVVSNPPYLTDAEMASASPEVQHEPRTALVGGGVDGLDWYRRFIPRLPQIVAPGGWFGCEIGIAQGASVVQLLRAVGASDAQIRPDFSGRDRFVTAWFV